MPPETLKFVSVCQKLQVTILDFLFGVGVGVFVGLFVGLFVFIVVVFLTSLFVRRFDAFPSSYKSRIR